MFLCRFLPILRLILCPFKMTHAADVSKNGHPYEADIVFQFPNRTFIENLHVLPNGAILFSTLVSGDLYFLDPQSHNPRPLPIANLDGSTGLTGIVPLGRDRFAVTGGIHSSFSFVRGSMRLYVVSLSTKDPITAKVIDTIPVPDTSMLNGMVVLPRQPNTVLSADSIDGRILRINTETKEVTVAFADAAIAPGGNAGVPFGANGLKLREDYLYFTNSALGTYCRYRIDGAGDKIGDIEVLASLGSVANVSNAYDDFDFDDRGNVYIAVHSASVNKVTPNGEQSLFAGGSNDTTFQQPTSVATAVDGRSIFVTTGGAVIGNKTYGGQIINVKLEN
ncbi:hypothetical protein F4808DRAFT_324500 [Astrocystis sublimbata]|nr:hypothetical protein F4808DRAFT_324500 [Astrocystis sublimbata]